VSGTNNNTSRASSSSLMTPPVSKLNTPDSKLTVTLLFTTLSRMPLLDPELASPEQATAQMPQVSASLPSSLPLARPTIRLLTLTTPHTQWFTLVVQPSPSSGYSPASPLFQTASTTKCSQAQRPSSLTSISTTSTLVTIKAPNAATLTLPLISSSDLVYLLIFLMIVKSNN
jgi:hypothetical protein